MPYEEAPQPISVDSGADYSSGNAQDRFVVMGTDKRFTLAGAASRALGVCTDKPIENQAGRVVIGGVTPVVAGTGGLTAGDDIAVGALGTAITQTASNPRMGKAMESAIEGAKAACKIEPSG